MDYVVQFEHPKSNGGIKIFVANSVKTTTASKHE
jgi:hypothetical protein